MVADDFFHTYDLVRMRDKSPKFTKEVPKMLKRLRLKLLLPFPQVLHPCTYEDWYNWYQDLKEDYKNLGKIGVYDATSIFLMLILSIFLVHFSLTMIS